MVKLTLKIPGGRTQAVHHIDLDKSSGFQQFLCLIQALKRYADSIKNQAFDLNDLKACYNFAQTKFLKFHSLDRL